MNNNQKKNKETIFVIGNFNIDLIFYPVNRQIRWGEERTVDNMIVRSAGSAGYTTHTLASLGIVPKIIGNLGNDHYGKTIIKSLESYGIVTKNLRIENCPTGISITVVNSKGERAFITYLGHLKHFTSKTATEYLLNISKIDYVMFSGYFLLPSLSEKGAIDILTLCKEKGALILFDPGWDPMGWKPNKINEIKRILEYVDIFIPNKEEAYAITNKNIAEEAVCNLLKLGPKKVIVKMGNKGSVFKEMDSNSVFVPPFSTSVFDTTGAGDSFNAGIIYGLIKNWNPEKILTFANAVASYTISKNDNRYPDVKSVMKIIQKSTKE